MVFLAGLAGWLFGGMLVIAAIGRLIMWLTKRDLGDTANRIYWSYGPAVAVGFLVTISFGTLDKFWALPFFTGIDVLVELYLLHRRNAKSTAKADATASTPGGGDMTSRPPTAEGTVDERGRPDGRMNNPKLSANDIATLERLFGLWERGALTDEEFALQKATILQTSPPSSSVPLEPQNRPLDMVTFSKGAVPRQLPSGETIAIRNKNVPELVRALPQDQLVTADPIAELLRPDGPNGNAALWDIGHAVPGLDRDKTARSFMPWTFLTPTPDTPHYLG